MNPAVLSALEIMDPATNYRAYALGWKRTNGFYVHCIVWDLDQAWAERRNAEQIRVTYLTVGPKLRRQGPRRPAAVTTEQAAMQTTTPTT